MTKEHKILDIEVGDLVILDDESAVSVVISVPNDCKTPGIKFCKIKTSEGKVHYVTLVGVIKAKQRFLDATNR